MGNRPALTLIAQPDAYFHELVTEALGHQNVSTQPETEFYLVNLLNKFMKSDRLNLEEPLALMLKQALEQSVPAMPGTMFQHIGDTSLYIAGFFQDSLNRKLVDVDYYIDMGGAAYRYASSRGVEEFKKLLYGELASRFGTFVDILAEVSDKTTSKTEKDILRLYELWVRTKSERAAKALQEAGILPNDTIKKEWQ